MNSSKVFSSWHVLRILLSKLVFDEMLNCERISLIKKDITKQVIAMGFPAVGVEGLYRNPRADVKK